MQLFNKYSISLLSGVTALLTGCFIPGSAVAITPTEADKIMTDELRLKIIGCGIPKVTRIQIGAEERCTLDLPGEKRYLYDAGTKKLIDVSTGTTQPATGTGGTDASTPASGPRRRAQTQLVYGDVVDSTISESSAMQQSSTGAFGQVAVKGRGDTFTFNAQQGDQIAIKTSPQGGLKPFVALIAPDGKQVANDSDGNLRYTTTATGTHRIVVLGDQNTLGAYTLSLGGTRSSASSPTGTGANAANRAISVRAPFNDLERSRMVDAVYRGWSRLSRVQRVDNITITNPNNQQRNGAFAVVLNVDWRDRTGKANRNEVFAAIDRTNEIGFVYRINNQWQNWVWTGERL
ncbi:MAG: hypothetical protein NW220_14595 [Leptolyngbyaceae cyanobacterium bins.349]|nr:hypothetical protein [Leptolyngbyaceae cyanobacterium bins.349]